MKDNASTDVIQTLADYSPALSIKRDALIQSGVIKVDTGASSTVIKGGGITPLPEPVPVEPIDSGISNKDMVTDLFQVYFSNYSIDQFWVKDTP